jgi:hypothetical protein
MSRGTQVGAEEWFPQSNKGIVALGPVRYRLIWPNDHKHMRTRWVNSGEQKWVRSCER